MHTFDYWAGTFDVWAWSRTAGPPTGVTTNTRDYDGCVIVEHFTSLTSGSVGMSMSFYDVNRRVWRMIWNDDANSSNDFEGTFHDGAMHFLGWVLDPAGRRVMASNTLTPVSPDTIRQTYAVSPDSGKTWVTMSDGRYVRRHAETAGTNASGNAMANTSPIVAEGVVAASPGEVWSALTTGDGLRSWFAPKADLDLRVGGAVRTNFDAAGALDGPGATTSTLLAVEPGRLLVTKVTTPPRGFPFANALARTVNTTQLEGEGANRTRVRMTVVGFGADEESQRLRAFLERDRALEIESLQRRFAPSAKGTAGSATGATSRSDLAWHSFGTWGVDLGDLDPAVKPGDNFYMSRNGAWFNRTHLTSNAFAAFWNDLPLLARRRVLAIVGDAAANPETPPESSAGIAATLYRSFMDENAIETRGVAPLEPELDAIRGATSREALATQMGHDAGPRTTQWLKRVTLPPALAPFTLQIAQDSRDPGRYAVYVGQGGLGLAGPGFYSDPKLADFRAAYEAYIAQVLGLVHWPDAAKRAREILAFETRVAAVSWPFEKIRDPVATYNAMSVDDLVAFAPGFDWRAFLRGADLGKVRRVVIDARDAFPAIARIVSETPVEVLQAREAFALADDAAPNLDSTLYNANYAFRFLRFSNQSAVVRRSRANRAYLVMNTNIPGVLGALYADRYFSPAARATVKEMATNLRAALDKRLQDASWMSPATKATARAKLAAMQLHLGDPASADDYHDLEVRDDDLYGNVVRAAAFEWQREVRHLDGPYDRSEWFLAADQVNYSYLPASNTVEIPAGTFEAPFFDPTADPAVNYGAIGAIIGSQMIGAFDNVGRHYDAEGRLRDWWTPAESQAFQRFVDEIAAQYSTVAPLPGLHLNGPLVANEAVDDFGGLTIALDAYHRSLGGKPAPVLDGFTGDQRFFLGRAQMWRAKFDPAFIRTQTTTGVNAPPFMRVNGPLRNMEAWYRAFGAVPGDSMYLAPQRRVRIW